MSTYIAWENYGDSRHQKRLYVSEYPGEGGVDWGYNPNIEKAKKMPKWWLQRFLKNQRVCGHHLWQYGYREVVP